MGQRFVSVVFSMSFLLLLGDWNGDKHTNTCATYTQRLSLSEVKEGNPANPVQRQQLPQVHVKVGC